MPRDEWFKAGARIARTGGDGWSVQRVTRWVLTQCGSRADARDAAKGWLAERRLVKQHGAIARTGKRLGKP